MDSNKKPLQPSFIPVDQGGGASSDSSDTGTAATAGDAAIAHPDAIASTAGLQKDSTFAVPVPDPSKVDAVAHDTNQIATYVRTGIAPTDPGGEVKDQNSPPAIERIGVSSDTHLTQLFNENQQVVRPANIEQRTAVGPISESGTPGTPYTPTIEQPAVNPTVHPEVINPPSSIGSPDATRIANQLPSQPESALRTEASPQPGTDKDLSLATQTSDTNKATPKPADTAGSTNTATPSSLTFMEPSSSPKSVVQDSTSNTQQSLMRTADQPAQLPHATEPAQLAPGQSAPVSRADGADIKTTSTPPGTPVNAARIEDPSVIAGGTKGTQMPDASGARGLDPGKVTPIDIAMQNARRVDTPTQNNALAPGDKGAVGGSSLTTGSTDKTFGVRTDNPSVIASGAKGGPQTADVPGMKDGVGKFGTITPVDIATQGASRPDAQTQNNAAVQGDKGGSSLTAGPADKGFGGRTGDQSVIASGAKNAQTTDAAGKVLDASKSGVTPIDISKRPDVQGTGAGGTSIGSRPEASGKAIEATAASTNIPGVKVEAGVTPALQGGSKTADISGAATTGGGKLVDASGSALSGGGRTADAGGTSIGSRPEGIGRPSDAATIAGQTPDAKIASQRIPADQSTNPSAIPMDINKSPQGKDVKAQDISAQGIKAQDVATQPTKGQDSKRGDGTTASVEGGSLIAAADQVKAGTQARIDSLAEGKKKENIVEVAAGKDKDAPAKGSKVFDAIVSKALADLNFENENTRKAVQTLLKRMDLAALSNLDEKSRLKINELVDQATKGQGIERIKKMEGAEANAQAPKSFIDKLADFLHINREGVIGKQLEVLKDLAAHIRNVSREFGLPTDKSGLTLANVMPPNSFEKAFANALLTKQGPERTKAALTSEISNTLKNMDAATLNQKAWFGELDKQGQKIVQEVAMSLQRARKVEEKEKAEEIKSPTEFISKLLELVYDKEINKEEEALVEAVMAARVGAPGREEEAEKITSTPQPVRRSATWQKESLHRRPYIVQMGDTLEIIAAQQLRDKALAGLIFEINQLPHQNMGNRTIVDLQTDSVIYLPTELEGREYIAAMSGKPTQIFEYKHVHYDPLSELQEKYGTAEDFSAAAAELEQAGVIHGTDDHLHLLNQSLERPADTVLKAILSNAESHSEEMKIAESVPLVVPDNNYRLIVQKKGREPIDDNCKIEIEKLSKTARLLKYEGGSGKPGHPLQGVQLQIKINDEWILVSSYEIYSQLSVKFEYGANNKFRDIRLDLPPESVWEMAANDLAQNWQSHSESFSANTLPHKT